MSELQFFFYFAFKTLLIDRLAIKFVEYAIVLLVGSLGVIHHGRPGGPPLPHILIYWYCSSSEFEPAPVVVLGLCGMGGSSGMSSRNLSSLLLNASVLHDRSLIFLGRQLNSLGPMVLKLFAWIVLILWDTQSIDFLTQVLPNRGCV